VPPIKHSSRVHGALWHLQQLPFALPNTRTLTATGQFKQFLVLQDLMDAEEKVVIELLKAKCFLASEVRPANKSQIRFLPRHAMHSAAYAVAKSPSVCLSVCYMLVFYRNS